jgi:hypothetical protein
MDYENEETDAEGKRANTKPFRAWDGVSVADAESGF